MIYATEANLTQTEKHSSAPEFEFVKIDCNSVNYKTKSLVKYLYEHHCLPEGWIDFFKLEAVKTQIKLISLKLEEDAKSFVIEPPIQNMFHAFEKISPKDVKVVILGQDPTPQPNQATGMAFSLKPGTDPSTVPSVFNMLVELKLEGLNRDMSNGDLTRWRDQGVLLLNTALTVRQRQAGSHAGGWREFTKLLIQYLNKTIPPSAWILWGRDAQVFRRFITNHYVKLGYHPSPRGHVKIAGFFGGNYFLCANEFLRRKGRPVVDWQLESVRLSREAEERAKC